MPYRLKSESGAVLVFVAVAMLGLLLFTAFAADYGVMWVARGGAQNAADAGALAGAQSLLALDGDQAARDAARAVTQQQRIFATPAATAGITVTVPLACPPPWNTPDGCIRVDVTKQDVPTFFAKLANIQSQGVKATATAMVGAGNSVECIKPWVVADKWIDNSGTGLNTSGWDQMDAYNTGVDQYVPPGFKATGPGNDFGTQLVIKEGQSGNYTSGWTMQIEFGVSGSNAYRDALEGCPDWIPTVGLYDGTIPCSAKGDTPDPTRGCLDVKPGMAQGPTQQGVTTIVGRDSGAYYDPSTKTIQGGCMAANTCELSPRIVPVAIFNTAAYVAMDAAGGCAGGNCRAQVVNIIGFFIEGMCNDVFSAATRPPYCGTNAEASKAVVGRIINYPAQASSVAGAPGPATFLRTTLLVR